MDIKMPVCDGIKAFSMLKESDDTNEIPVLFMTAFPTPEYVKKVNQMGAKGCISKPFISHEFEQEIQQALA
jgi:CheY-like chemotaxis protein